MFVDIHTHNYDLDNQCVIKVVCLNPFDFEYTKSVMDSDSRYFSTGIHPWDVKYCNSTILHKLEEIVKRKQIVAIGEVGLDRIHKETFMEQRDVLQKMIKLSEENHKPMIIHSTRAYSDVIFEKKKSGATMPWIIHGFNGSVEAAQQLIAHDMFLSFGELLYRNENKAVSVLKSVSSDRIFLETDVSGRSIVDVYKKAATLINCEIGDLERIIFENFKKIFGDGKLEEQDTNTCW